MTGSLENAMTHTLRLTHPQALPDLANFLGRARRINDGATRVIATDRFLQVYVGVFLPRGLLDATPTVLGLRVFELAEAMNFDEVVPIEALISRAERAHAYNGELRLPSPSPSITWSAISPPRDGWQRKLGVSAEILRTAAEEGVHKVKEAIPDSVGEAIVQKVRAEVWGAPLPGKKKIPAGAGFAADALGLLTERSLSVHTVGNWIRLSAKHGYVLVKTGVPLDDWDEEPADD
jgi:hypothetical protein